MIIRRDKHCKLQVGKNKLANKGDKGIRQLKMQFRTKTPSPSVNNEKTTKKEKEGQKGGAPRSGGKAPLQFKHLQQRQEDQKVKIITVTCIKIQATLVYMRPCLKKRERRNVHTAKKGREKKGKG